ncbi:hypothetical protein F5Y05DRAFT_191829 [Hypoxylon sp. FL0543]|nr:hypothetical protein F5Y05DRAFT_191829 [Hypoxylon sp. FL0543]
MESSPVPDRPFDPSKPFEGLVLCCTSIEADLRTEIAQRTVDLGGVHKYDLTPDVTHLIVGDYDTAKYRHVARERPDIKPMAAGWVDAVRELWLEDKEFDFAALENTWRLKTFETGGGIPKSPVEEQRERARLICCLTGFEDNETRATIEDKVKANGGIYVGDLSRRATHLIVNKPEGKKYAAARKWGIRTVSIEWLYDSIERGMILHEECYDPTLPAEERGKGAWIRRDLKRGASLGKRSRDGSAAVPSVDDGRRKLRKTASMKLTSQRDVLWDDILVKQSSTDLSRAAAIAAHNERPASVPPIHPTANPFTPVAIEIPSLEKPSDEALQLDGGIFSLCRFYVHGFIPKRQEILHQHITSHDGQISLSIEDVASSNHNEPLDRRYLIVPQTSQPDSHPELPEGIHIVTEFYIERCVHNKTRFEPNDHVLGQPFPRFPIDGFHELIICTAGFKNEQLNQVEKAVTQLGAKYSERLNAQCTLLICPSLDDVRKQKLDYAIFSKIPVVSADWLWNSITTGCLVPWSNFLFEVSQKSVVNRKDSQRKEGNETARSKSESAPRRETKPKAASPAMKHGMDMTAFDDDMPMQPEPPVQDRETDGSNFETAPTHQLDSMGANPATASAPLSEMTSNALNKSPSPQKTVAKPRKLKRFPTGGEVQDSESGDDSDAPINQAEDEDDTPKDEEQERRRQAERDKAAEREELSKRLNSLVAPSNAPQEGDGMKPQPAPRQRRRRREILGRAASNVSTASSASAESAAHLSSSKSNLRRTESTASRLDLNQASAGDYRLMYDMTMGHSNDNNQATQSGDSPPRATQLGYDISEAREHRAVVMDRMQADSKQGDSSGKKPSQGKPSLASLNDEVGLSANTQKSSRRRSTRRR